MDKLKVIFELAEVRKEISRCLVIGSLLTSYLEDYIISDNLYTIASIFPLN